MSEVDSTAGLAAQVAILVLALLSLGTFWLAGRKGSPILSILGRWIRWFFFAALLAGTAQLFFFPHHNPALLFAAAILLWFCLETAYNWFAISALSKSSLPLFPRYEENHRGDEWPSQAPFIALKDWIRQQGMERRQALVAQVGEDVLMRVSTYENAEKTIRMHVYFLPFSGENMVACLSFQSEMRSGERILTDNLFLPFGGFYPEDWTVERHPWKRSAESLFQRHRARLDALAKDCKVLLRTPLEQMNNDQRVIQKLNRELGFLHDANDEAELGRLTPAGKARVWQELWLLTYLGRPLRYA